MELNEEEEEMVRRKRLFTEEGKLVIEKDKWNAIMKNCRNPQCREHGYIQWWGDCVLWADDDPYYSQIIGFSCPQCELEEFGKYEERSIEVYLRGYY